MRALTDKDSMPFGQHQGKRMEDVPAEYLDWLRDQTWLAKSYPEVAEYIERMGDVIDAELGEMQDE